MLTGISSCGCDGADPLAPVAPHKKRKRGKRHGQGGAGGNLGASDGLGNGADGAEGAGAAALEPWQRETSVQVAVLELLEGLLQVGPNSALVTFVKAWLRT